jgi:cytochrome b561
MKAAHWIAILIAILAVIFTGMGGLLDSWKGSRFEITKQHAWNDGIFLMLLAIFIVIVS